MSTITKNNKTDRRRARVRAKISGDAVKPRVSVFRGAKDLYVQVIDDTRGHTLASLKLSGVKVAGKPVDKALILGEQLAAIVLKQGIKTVTFDRNRYKYHGQVKAVAEGLRAGGLIL